MSSAIVIGNRVVQGAPSVIIFGKGANYILTNYTFPSPINWFGYSAGYG